MKTLALAALAVAALSSAPSAQEFPYNAMLLATNDGASAVTGSVRLVDPDGSPMSLMVNLANPVDATIGPDGRLYVVSAGDDRVRVISYNGFGGTVDNIIGAGSGLTALCFGPQGNLFVASQGDDVVYEFRLDGLLVGSLGSGSPMADPVDLAFGADGTLFVASESAGRVHHYNPAGDYLGEIGSAGMAEASGLAFGPDGRMYVSSSADDRVFVYDSAGVELLQIGIGSGLDQPGGLSFGPDGRLYVVSRGDDRIYVFNDDGTLQRTVEPSLPTSLNQTIGFVPHRFTLSGQSILYRDGKASTKTKGVATLSIQPGSNRIMMHLPDGNKLGDVFGDEFVVFYGFEAYSNDPKLGKKREYHGQCVPRDGIADGVGSLAIEVQGGPDVDGFFVIKKAKGMLLRQNAGASSSGKVSTKTLLL